MGLALFRTARGQAMIALLGALIIACAATYGACISVLDHERDRAALTLAQRQRDFAQRMAEGEAQAWSANLGAAEANLQQLILLAEVGAPDDDPAPRLHLQHVRAAWASLRAGTTEVHGQSSLAKLSAELDALVVAYERRMRARDRASAGRLAVVLASATPLLAWALIAISRDTAPQLPQPGPTTGHDTHEAVFARRRRLAARLHDQPAPAAGPRATPERMMVDLYAAADDELQVTPGVAHTTRRDDPSLAHELRLYAADFRQITGLEVELAIDERAATLAPRPTQPQALNIVREALCNIRRHASATRVSISLWSECGSVWLAVADDGASFHPEHPGESKQPGLQIMRARAEQIGAELRISSRHGAGTQVVVRLPAPERPGDPIAVVHAPHRAF